MLRVLTSHESNLSQTKHFQIPIRPGPEQKKPLCGYATYKSLFIYVLIYLFIYTFIYLFIDFTWLR